MPYCSTVQVLVFFCGVSLAVVCEDVKGIWVHCCKKTLAVCFFFFFKNPAKPDPFVKVLYGPLRQSCQMAGLSHS